MADLPFTSPRPTAPQGGQAWPQTPQGQMGGPLPGPLPGPGTPPPAQTAPPSPTGMEPQPGPWCAAFPESCRDYFQRFASPEEFTAHYLKTLGRTHEMPAGPDGYQLDIPAEIDESDVRGFRTLLYELGISARAAQRIVDFERNRIQRILDREARERGNWADELRMRKGWQGEDLRQNVRQAQRAMSAFGTPGLRTLLASTGYGMHPEVLDFFLSLGKRLAESPFVEGEPPRPEPDYPVMSDGIPLLTFPNTRW